MSDEVMQLVELLNGSIATGSKGNAEKLAAWETARHVVVRPRTEANEETPPIGEGKPAA